MRERGREGERERGREGERGKNPKKKMAVYSIRSAYCMLC